MIDPNLRNEDGTYKASGNPNGRPKGSKNKALTDKKLAEYLGKRTETALEVVMDIMRDSEESGATRLKAAIAWITTDEKMRQFMHKKTMDAINQKQKESDQGSKSQEKESSVVVSLKAID